MMSKRLTFNIWLDKLRSLLLTTCIFVTEKYDGTNIAKDEEGIIYSRRLILPPEEETFLKTNLRRVKDANIEGLKNLLLESIGE